MRIFVLSTQVAMLPYRVHVGLVVCSLEIHIYFMWIRRHAQWGLSGDVMRHHHGRNSCECHHKYSVLTETLETTG